MISKVNKFRKKSKMLKFSLKIAHKGDKKQVFLNKV